MRPGNRVALACLALLVAGGPARADEAADKLFEKGRTTAKEAMTLQADVSYQFSVGDQKGGMNGTVRMMKPNYVNMRLTEPDGKGGLTTVTDGKNAFLVRLAEKQYQKLSVRPTGFEGPFAGPSGLSAPIGSFFTPEGIRSTPEHRADGTRQVNGKSYQVVRFPSQSPPGTGRYFFSEGGLLEGVEVEVAQEGQKGTISLWLKNVKVNAPMTAQQFAYTPPAGFQLFQPRSPDQMLLPVGQTAPEFQLPMPGGGQLSLESARKGKKAVLVNFWFYHWGACREEFPHLQKIYDELKDKGLELVAVNANDPEERIQKYVKENNFTFKIVMGGSGPQYTLGKAYGVMAYPTNYLIDGDGKVLWRSVGFNEAALRAELEKLGLK